MDIMEWHSGMVSRGAFEGHLTTEQQITKNQIEDMIEESSRTDTPKKVSMKTLQSYEAIFKTDDLKDETEMDETEMYLDDEEEDDSSYEFENPKTVKTVENVEKKNRMEQKGAEVPSDELPKVMNKTDGSENVTGLKESKNHTLQNVTKINTWMGHLGKCNRNKSCNYLDLFYKNGGSIQNSMLNFCAKSSRKLTVKKQKKKKLRKRKNPRTQRTCRMKTRCSLRCWLSFESKMCIPRFNWLAVNVTRNGFQFEEYFPFPDKPNFEKQKQIFGDSVKLPETVKSKLGNDMDGVPEKLRNKDEKQETDVKPTQRMVANLLKPKKSNSGEDLSVDKVTKIIDEKSREQLMKIQTLELSISKLENRILREQLSKTNDSSSISRLENHILRLENELIKLNQTYIELRQENEQLKKGQRRYLELSHGPLQNQSDSENYTLVIGHHKTKLTELTYQLRNQSELVSKFKKQLDQVEDQNRMLYQIVMNQSLLISQVMKKIQILNDQIQESNQKQQGSTGSMTPTDLMKHLENMVILNKKSKLRTKRFSSSQKHDLKQSLKYHGYKTCMSKTCSKLNVADQDKVKTLSTDNRQVKGDLPKSATVKIPDLEKRQGGKLSPKEKLNSGTGKENKNFNVETKSKEVTGPGTKAKETETKTSISLQKKQNGGESKDKSKPKTDKIQVEKSRDADEFSKQKILSDSKVVKVPETKKEEKIASGRKKPLYEDQDNKEPNDCYELHQKGNTRNGAYKIKPVGFKKLIEVFCDMKNGGWTVIQRRQGGTTSFLRDWSMYKKGFGGVYGEHWIGNDVIHHLTNQKECKLRIDLTDWNKNKVTAFYDYFMVDHESEGYLLHVEGFSGEGGDSFSKHNLNKFSTKDVDNDKVTKQFGGSCAKRFSGAWWYHKCYSSNLNGVFYRNGAVAEKKFDGIAWKSWKGPNYSLMKTEMKIAPATAEMK